MMTCRSCLGLELTLITLAMWLVMIFTLNSYKDSPHVGMKPYLFFSLASKMQNGLLDQSYFNRKLGKLNGIGSLVKKSKSSVFGV